MNRNLKEKFNELNTSQIIALGFAILIIMGGLILWMPFCAAPGETTSFSDAMFTSTTCVCVTGLVTVTTAAHWSMAGKVVILILIQAGGIGVVALASLLFITMNHRISMKNRRMIQESYNVDQLDGMMHLVVSVIICIFAAEFLGAIGYAIRFIPQFGPKEGIWQAIFTSISTFCNAGVDILGENSLANYVTDPLVNFVAIALIVLSGLGFTVWWDLGRQIKKVFQRKLSVRRVFKTLRFHSKMVLITTGILLFGGMFLILIFEFNNPDTIGNMTFGEKLMASAFQSVTTRTAGFFTIDQAKFSNASTTLCLLLMFIGGSPMGTAGGVKTTTIAVLVLCALSSLKGTRDVEFQHRRIRKNYVRSAVVVVGTSFTVLFVSSMLMAAAMPGSSLADVLYEITSAVATVGLSRGLTGVLTTNAKWIVIVTMYLGRIGPLTLGTAVLLRAEHHTEKAHLAEEDLMIG